MKVRKKKLTDLSGVRISEEIHEQTNSSQTESFIIRRKHTLQLLIINKPTSVLISHLKASHDVRICTRWKRRRQQSRERVSVRSSRRIASAVNWRRASEAVCLMLVLWWLLPWRGRVGSRRCSVWCSRVWGTVGLRRWRGARGVWSGCIVLTRRSAGGVWSGCVGLTRRGAVAGTVRVLRVSTGHASNNFLNKNELLLCFCIFWLTDFDELYL